ncbi:MAG TPA: type II toxin-antitoxin system VapC family toxin [archaeon]|nr:type II toxin-antitoxin system VapC family toxin [archaeon]
MILLDTTFLIDLLRGKENVKAKFESLSHLTVFTTRINVFEVLVGIFSLKRDEQFIDKQVNAAFALFDLLNILELDESSTMKSAHIAAKLNKDGLPIGSTDCLIAGVALANGINTIISRNTIHFERIEGLKVVGY